MTHHQTRLRRRPGFSLVEVMGAMVIVAILSALVIPVVYQRLKEARVDAIVQEFESIRSGMFMYYRDVTKYPPRVDYLTALESGPTDICGNPLTARNIAGYKGPYLSRQIIMLNPLGGLTRYAISSGDSVESVITRTTISAITGPTDVLQIWVYGPELDIANMIDQRIDGTIDGTSGVIQTVGNPSPNEFIVKYNIPIKNPC